MLAPQISTLLAFVSIRQRMAFPLHFWIQIASCIALCGALLQPASAVINFCLSGSCDIDNPIYVNVYWDKSKDQWNADIRVADPSATVDAIDALTNAVCHSAYFRELWQYAVTSCTTLPSIVENGCGRVPDNLDSARDQLGRFATCVISHHPYFDLNRTVLNVFLPPQTKAVPGSDFCDVFDGYHDKFGSPVAVTFNMTDPVCHSRSPNTGIAGISKTLTHEMVEAATDPVPMSPSGWKLPEIGDACEDKTPASAQFLYGRVSLYFSNMLNFCTDSLIGTTDPVSISGISACGSGSQMKITVKGSVSPKPWDLADDPAGGSSTQFVQEAISGTDTWSAGKLQPPPSDSVGLGRINWDHPPAPPSCSLGCESQEVRCLAAAEAAPDSGDDSLQRKLMEEQACRYNHHNCSESCQSVTITPPGDTIVIHGFDDRYGMRLPSGYIARVQPKDTISVTLWSFLNGSSATATVKVPAANEVKNFKFRPSVHQSLPVHVGDEVSISGRLVDAKSGETCGVEGAELVPKSDHSADTFYPVLEETAGDGSFSFQYTAGGRAGQHHVRIPSPLLAELLVPVHPLADSLSDTVGAAEGGQIVTLKGHGFDAGATKVIFMAEGSKANAPSVEVVNHDTIRVTTPPSPRPNHGPGVVDVIASVEGLDSVPLSYRYVVPNRPVFYFTPSCRLVGEAINSLEVNAYNSDGTASEETIALSTTDAMLLNGSGQLVSSLAINPGTTIQMKGIGPVTATPSADPALAVTAKFKEGPPCTLPSPQSYAALDVGPQNGPPSSQKISAVTSLDGRLAVWDYRTEADPAADEGDFIVLKAEGKAPVAVQQWDVSVQASSELRALVREAPSAIARKQESYHHVRFLGPNFSVQASSKAPPSNPKFASPLLLSFGLPHGPDATGYRVLHLAPNGGGWSEVEASVQDNHGQRTLQGSIGEPGTYALARLEP